MAKRIGSRTINVIREIKKDSLDTSATDDPESHEIKGCVVLPRGYEEAGKGWVIVEGRMIIAPFGSDVLADDKVQVDGRTWDVDGEPGYYEKKSGRGKAVLFYLKRLGT